MSAGNGRVEPSILAELISELERGSASRPEEMARPLGREWTEDDVRGGLAALFSDGVVGHSHEVGFWWVA